MKTKETVLVFNKSMFVAGCLAVLLAGCGGGGGGTSVTDSVGSLPTASNDSGSSSLEVALKSFTLSGTGPEVSGKIPIDANINEGAFRIDWETEGTGIYSVALYVSVDDKLDEVTDPRFFYQNCQEGMPFMKCGRKGSFDCRFTTENKILCGEESIGNRPKDLSTFLTALPQSAYIIFKFQNGYDILSSKSTNVPVAVMFQ